MHIERETSIRPAVGRMAALLMIFSLLPTLTVFCLPAGCSKKEVPHPPPPAVTVAKPVVQKVTDFLEYPSTLTGIETVDIRARVEGFLQSIEFQPRQMVEPNQLLFVIEPKQYKAQVDEAQANVNKAKADQKLAETTFIAEDELYKKGAEAKYSRDQAEAKVGVAKGQVDQVVAALEIAKNNLGYTQVVSPIHGRVSRNLVDVGNLVGAGEKTLLTTVVNDSQVYAYFNVSENDVLAVRKAHAHTSSASKPSDIHVPVFMGLADETGCPHVGRLDFINNELDASTGTLQLRAVFDNPDHFLIAGLYARVRVPIREFQGMLLPDTAVLSDQGGKYVLRVNDQNVVEQARVTVGKVYMEMRVIEDGVKPDDRIVINGMQKARPGAKVAPTITVLKEVQMPSIQTASRPADPQTRPAGPQQPQPADTEIKPAKPKLPSVDQQQIKPAGPKSQPATQGEENSPIRRTLESFGQPAGGGSVAEKLIASRAWNLTTPPAGGR